ncbi:hypothetical protein [Corynebacterium diphtheriae]|uniref:hypothetical protein n=1 Tax=Corynebacterium diphtheriae TaxID=1717 RepID=UPI0012FFE1D5|nr:hypothetical protein [Corynebacterium diphtheriae]
MRSRPSARPSLRSAASSSAIVPGGQPGCRVVSARRKMASGRGCRWGELSGFPVADEHSVVSLASVIWADKAYGSGLIHPVVYEPWMMVPSVW